jgi:hypothetical protein
VKKGDALREGIPVKFFIDNGIPCSWDSRDKVLLSKIIERVLFQKFLTLLLAKED